MTKLHCIWGLGQLARKENQSWLSAAILDDADPEVRAQAAKTMGDHRLGFTPIKGSAEDQRWTKFSAKLVRHLLQDPSPRVKFFAAQTLARIGRGQVREPIIKMLQKNADSDPYLRHAGVMAMAGNFDRAELIKIAKHASPYVRLAAVLAMRNQQDSEVRVFLNDNDPKVVLEAARAITDTSLHGGYADLSVLLDRPASTMKDWPPTVTEPLFQRAAAAAFRLGRIENAQALARFAARADVSNKVRLEALKYLSDWGTPPVRDRVDGLARITKPRPAQDVVAALRPALAGIMTAPELVRTEGVKLAAKYGIKEITPILRSLVADVTGPSSLRIETFLALEKLQDSGLFDLAETAIKDDNPRLRHQARRVLLQKRQPADAASLLAGVVDKGAMVERQGAFTLLGQLQTPEADKILSHWLDLLLEKKAPLEMQLDILEAARRRSSTGVKDRLKKIEAARPKTDHLAGYRETMFGGDAEAGRKIFFHRAELSCLRCHKVNGVGGEVGPDLTGIGKKQTRAYLLESLIDPDRQIAKGFETVVLVLTNGKVESGILRHEDAKEIHLMNPEGRITVVAVSQIEERNRGKSAMPEDLKKHMSLSDLRDLVEYLAGL